VLNENQRPELKIDPEFKALIPPLSAGEISALREDVSIYGCRDPLIDWKDQGIILDGHHRYEICKELGIRYKVVELEFPSRIEAKIWMIKNQRGRRNLNESQRAMLQ
jgi:ParB-like chromosome segregation protein Spo0J